MNSLFEVLPEDISGLNSSQVLSVMDNFARQNIVFQTIKEIKEVLRGYPGLSQKLVSNDSVHEIISYFIQSNPEMISSLNSTIP